MLATEDYLDALGWAKSLGGYKALVARADSNLAVIESMVSKSPWLEFLSGPDPTVRSRYFCDIWEKWGRHIWEKRVVGICFVFPSYSRGALEHECLPLTHGRNGVATCGKKCLLGFVSFSPPTLEVRSNTSVCLSVTDMDGDQVKAMAALLEKEGVALDIGAYRSAPPGFRIWCGPTVEASDLGALMPWIEWAHAEVKAA
jgi:phosphoserine aminotransferase